MVRFLHLRCTSCSSVRGDGGRYAANLGAAESLSVAGLKTSGFVRWDGVAVTQFAPAETPLEAEAVFVRVEHADDRGQVARRRRALNLDVDCRGGAVPDGSAFNRR